MGKQRSNRSFGGFTQLDQQAADSEFVDQPVDNVVVPVLAARIENLMRRMKKLENQVKEGTSK